MFPLRKESRVGMKALKELVEEAARLEYRYLCNIEVVILYIDNVTCTLEQTYFEFT